MAETELARRSPRASPTFLTRRAVCDRWNISRSTSYVLERQGYLPRPVRLGSGAMRFVLTEVEAAEKRLAADRPKARSSP